MMIAFHTIAGLLALLSGSAVVAMTKGTRRHKFIGRIYVFSMYALCLSSFAITDRTPYFRGFGLFHLIAAVGTIYLTIGFVPVLLRRRLKNWYVIHFYCMLWSFVGLIMALNSHFVAQFANLLISDFGLSRRASFPVSFLLLWGVPLVIGNILIQRKLAAFKKSPAMP